MKYIKTINELFDSEKLKSDFKSSYKQGNLSLDEIDKWIPLKSNIDPELNRLINECPYLVEFKYKSDGNIIKIGFDNSFTDNGISIFYYFLIEIVKLSNDYSLNVYAKCHDNDKLSYNESFIKKSISYKDLVSYMKKDVFYIAVDFSNFIEKMFNEENFPYKDKNDIIFNPGLN